MDRLLSMEVFVVVVELGVRPRGGGAPRDVGGHGGQGHIMGLEARLGLRLMNRTTRRQSLTEAGQGLLRAQGHPADIREAEQRQPCGSRRAARCASPRRCRSVVRAGAGDCRLPRPLSGRERGTGVERRGGGSAASRYDLAVRIGEPRDSPGGAPHRQLPDDHLCVAGLSGAPWHARDAGRSGPPPVPGFH